MMQINLCCDSIVTNPVVLGHCDNSACIDMYFGVHMYQHATQIPM